MTDRFMWGRRCALALFLSFFLTLTVSIAAADMQVGPVVSKSVRSKKINVSMPLTKTPTDRPEIVIGFVVDNDGLVKTSEAAQEIVTYLQEQLLTTVWMRRFDEEPQLYQWLTRFREVDAAWIRKESLKDLPGRDFSILVESSSSSPVALITHPDFDANLRKKISAALLDAEGNPSGRELISQLDVSHFSLPPQREALKSDADISRQGVEAVTQMSSTEKQQELAWQERVRTLPAPRRSSVDAVANQKVSTVVVEDPVTRTFRVVEAQSDTAKAQKASAISTASRRTESSLKSQDQQAPPQRTLQTVVTPSENEGAVSPSTVKGRQPQPVVIADPVTRTYRLADGYSPNLKAGRSVPVTVESPSKRPDVVADPVAQAYPVAENSIEEPETQKTVAEPVVSPALESTKEEPQQQVSSPSLESVKPSPVPSPVPREVVEQQPTAASSPLKETRSLARLVGKSEIPVLADSDEQFVRSMAANPVFEDDFERQVDETNLQESINVGRSFNRESLAALARTEQAQAQTGQALSQLLPSVTVRANRGYEISKPSVVVDEATGELIGYDKHMRTDAALTVRQPLFDLPRFLDWQRRKVKKQAREEGYRVSDGDAYISTINSYLSLVSSRLQADVTRDFEAQLADLLSYIKKRADAGAASVSDMTRVRARSESTMSSRLELESAHAAAGSEFVRLTNLVPQRVRIPVAEDVGASVLPDSFDEAVAIAMKSNPEIASLNAELEAAEIDQLAAKGRFLPRVDAEYTDTYSLHAGGAPSSDDQRDRRLMVVLNWELFSGGNDYNVRLERLAREKELQYRLDDQRRRVVQSLSANYSALATTRARIDSGYQELNAISTAAEAMSKRMLSGNQSLLDLLDVYNQLYQARFRLVGLHTLEMNTMAQLARLTHGAPWPVGEELPAVE